MNDMALVATLVTPGPHCVGHGSSMPVGQVPIEASAAAAEAATAGPSAEACSAHIPGCLLPCPQLANSWLVGAAADKASDTAAAAAAPAGVMEPQPAAAAAAADDDDYAQLQARQGSPPVIGPTVMTATGPSISSASTEGHTTSHTQQQQQQQEEEDIEGDDDGNSMEDSLEWPPMQLPEPLSGKAALQPQQQLQQGEAPPALSNAEPAAAGEGACEVPGMLQELDVSLDSLNRLLTGDCPVDTQQPVWMVINLQVSQVAQQQQQQQ